VTTRDRHTTREAAANTPWVAILRWNRSTAGTDAAGPICARDAAYRDDAPRSTSPRPNAAAHGRAEASRGLQEAAEDDAGERDLRRRRRAEAALYMGEGKWGAVVTAGAGAGAGGLLEAGMLCGRARRRGWGKLGISGLGLGPSPWLASPGGSDVWVTELRLSRCTVKSELYLYRDLRHSVLERENGKCGGRRALA
jgi:hypothetical protein